MYCKISSDETKSVNGSLAGTVVCNVLVNVFSCAHNVVLVSAVDVRTPVLMNWKTRFLILNCLLKLLVRISQTSESSASSCRGPGFVPLSY